MIGITNKQKEREKKGVAHGTCPDRIAVVNEGRSGQDETPTKRAGVRFTLEHQSCKGGRDGNGTVQ